MSDSYVSRPARRAEWNLVRAGKPIGSGHGLCRPDRRWFVSVDSWDESAYAPLVAAMAEDLRHDLYTAVDEADEVELRRWRALGFAQYRRGILFDVPVDPAVTGLAGARVPGGMALLSADAVDEDRLRELDDTLRTDVPGSDGWRNDPAEFHDYTFDERQYDPLTYLVAVDDVRRAFAGLVRVWGNERRRRLGLIGVVRGYRRRGLAQALLGAAFNSLHERGFTVVGAEADETNTASVTLLERIGARRVGATVELVRPAASR